MYILKGKITISISRDHTKVEITDSDASITFVKLQLDPKQLSAVLSGQGLVECDLEIRGLDRVGKKMEYKPFEFRLPKDSTRYDVDKKELWKHAQEILDGMVAEKGWIADGGFNSQDSFFINDGKHWARCIIRRWV